MTVFEMTSVDDKPSEKIFSLESEESDGLHRRRVFLDAANIVVDKYVDFSMEDDERSEENSESDHVYEYASEVLTLGLLYMEFIDAIREGDGGRILRCWRYLLLIFKSSGRSNYSIEAFTLLAQYHFIFTDRMHMRSCCGIEQLTRLVAQGRKYPATFTWST